MAQLKELMVAGDAQISGDLYAKNFSGTDGTTAGKAGLVPAPTTSDNGKYLKSDGTWATVSGGGGGTSDYTDLTNKPSINNVTLSGNKTTADLFTAGTNIAFDGKTISATDTTYSEATTSAAGLMSSTDKLKLDNTFKELTSPVRIWNLDDGTYKLPASCQIYYYGASDTSNTFTISTTGYLFVTHYSTTYKNWFIFCGNSSSTRYLYNGYSTSTGGANKAFNLGSSYLTGISSYVKNQLDYTTSNTTYALSAYQGYILNTNKADKTAFSGTDGSAAGTMGLVPAPAATDANKYLKSDGTWSTAVPITYSTTDLTAGSSPLDTGSFYFVYE